MTLVNAETGEILDMSESDARDLTNRIREGRARVHTLIRRAFTKRAWASLGYKSWDAYIAGEFDEGMLQLPREARRQEVASMRDHGMSTRAIAAGLGVSHPTVLNDLAAGGQDLPPDLDDEVVDAEIVDSPKVTGTDGKTYRASAPKAPTRRQEVQAMPAEDREACPYCGQDLPDHLQIPRDRRTQ